MTTAQEDRQQEVRVAGSIGFWSVVALAVILGIHPPGSSDLYDDGQQFLEHVDAFWVTIHFVGAVFFIAILVALWAWARDLTSGRARVVGQLGVLAAIAGTAVGSIHLVATDTTVFVMFTDTFEAGGGSEATTVAADLLVRLHASTLTAWVISYFITVPAVMGTAAWLDGRFPTWHALIAWVGAGLGAVAVIITIAEGQWTTLSEMGIFRPSVVLTAIWLIIATWWMRKGSIAPSTT